MNLHPIDFSKAMFLGHLGIKDPSRNVMKAEESFLPKCSYQQKCVCSFWDSWTSPAVHLWSPSLRCLLPLQVTNSMTTRSHRFMTPYISCENTRFTYKGSWKEIRKNQDTQPTVYLLAALPLRLCIGQQKIRVPSNGRMTRQQTIQAVNPHTHSLQNTAKDHPSPTPILPVFNAAWQ